MTIILDLEESLYHARPELSSTQARHLLDSPARYKHALTHKQASNAAFDVGSAVHAKVLGTGWDVAEFEFDNWRSKAAQTERDNARAAGLIPMLAKDMVEVNAMAEAVLLHDLARSLFEQDGAAEASVFATCQDTGVEMRARFDFLPTNPSADNPVVDLKTTAGSAAAHKFAKSVADYQYDVQRGHYLATLARHYDEAGTEFDTDTDMLFVVVEKTAPYLVAVHRLDDDFKDIGTDKALRAREVLAQCRRLDQWPGYPATTHTAFAPTYYLYDYNDRFNPEAEITI